MSHPRIKIRAKPPGAEQLATWTDDALQAQYEKHLSAWMTRSNLGQRQTWRKFEEMDAFHLELTRRKYGSGVAAEEKAVAANFKMGLVPKGEN